MKRYLVEFFGRENESGGLERFICLGIYAKDPSQIRPTISQTHEYWHISRVEAIAVEPGDYGRVRWSLCARGERYDYFTALEPVYERWYFTWAAKGEEPGAVMEGGYYNLGSLVSMKNDKILIDMRKGKS